MVDYAEKRIEFLRLVAPYGDRIKPFAMIIDRNLQILANGPEKVSEYQKEAVWSVMPDNIKRLKKAIAALSTTE